MMPPFATLEIVNEAGRKMASFLAQRSANISDHHRSRMRVDKVGMYKWLRSPLREAMLTNPMARSQKSGARRVGRKRL